MDDRARRAEELAGKSLALSLALLQMIAELRIDQGKDTDGVSTTGRAAFIVAEQARAAGAAAPAERRRSLLKPFARARRALTEVAPTIAMLAQRDAG